MSSSERRPGGKARPSRVIMAGGPGGAMEYTVAELTGDREAVWQAALDAEYLDRVTARAAERAKEVLQAAESEARALRKQAKEQGFAQGLEEADRQLEQVRRDMAGALARALDGVREGRKSIWEQHRKDLAALTCAAVEKILGLELAENRRAVITGFLDQAVDILETERRLTLRVSPRDREQVLELLRLAAKEIPQAKQWKVTADPSLEPGSLIAESPDGLVDNSMASRREAVMALLFQLRLPGGDAEGPGGDSRQEG